MEKYSLNPSQLCTYLKIEVSITLEWKESGYLQNKLALLLNCLKIDFGYISNPLICQGKKLIMRIIKKKNENVTINFKNGS